MGTLLRELRITHYKIRSEKSKHNKKVGRSHRNDNERFYNYLKFCNLENLIKQRKAYLKGQNNIPMFFLKYCHKYSLNSTNNKFNRSTKSL